MWTFCIAGSRRPIRSTAAITATRAEDFLTGEWWRNNRPNRFSASNTVHDYTVVRASFLRKHCLISIQQRRSRRFGAIAPPMADKTLDIARWFVDLPASDPKRKYFLCSSCLYTHQRSPTADKICSRPIGVRAGKECGKS